MPSPVLKPGGGLRNSLSATHLDPTGCAVGVGVDVDVNVESQSIVGLQQQINHLRLWVAVHNAPLQIPILTSKILTRDSLRTQFTGSVLFLGGIVLKMLFE